MLSDGILKTRTGRETADHWKLIWEDEETAWSLPDVTEYKVFLYFWPDEAWSPLARHKTQRELTQKWRWHHLIFFLFQSLYTIFTLQLVSTTNTNRFLSSLHQPACFLWLRRYLVANEPSKPWDLHLVKLNVQGLESTEFEASRGKVSRRAGEARWDAQYDKNEQECYPEHRFPTNGYLISRAVWLALWFKSFHLFRDTPSFR